MQRTLAARLEAKLIPEPNSGCMLWVGVTNGKAGYGMIRVNGRMKLAHRVAWELANGCSVPEGMQLDHKCRVRCCANPAHLEPVTPRENSLRGTPHRIYAHKTHCPRGHAYTPENTFVYGNCRDCLTCRQDRDRGRKR